MASIVKVDSVAKNSTDLTLKSSPVTQKKVLNVKASIANELNNEIVSG